MPNRKARIAIAVAIVLIVALVVGYALWRQLAKPAPAPSPTPTVTAAHSETSTPTKTPFPFNCPADPQPLDNPVQMIMMNQNHRELKMISLGLDASGDAAAAPPGNEPETVGWFNEGPKIGADKGKALLTSHTYQWGGALGNELINGLWTPGDIMMFVDASGKTACYEYTEYKHILTDNYDPNSDLIYDYQGKPEFAVVVCSDYQPDGSTKGRMVYYGKLLTDAPVAGEDGNGDANAGDTGGTSGGQVHG